MNFKCDLNEKNQELLQELGIKVEDRNYTSEEIQKCENNIANHIFSQSIKNKDVSKEYVKYSNLINILSRSE